VQAVTSRGFHGPRTTGHGLLFRFPGRGRPRRPRPGVHAAGSAKGRVTVDRPTTGREPLSKPPPRPSPKGRGLLFGCKMQATGARLAAAKPTSYKLQATGYVFFYLPLRGRWRRSRRRGVVCREVGSRRWVWASERCVVRGAWNVVGGLGHASALSVWLLGIQNPHPNPPQGEGA